MGTQSSRIQVLRREFDERGFLVLPSALPAQQKAIMSKAFDKFMLEHPDEWVHLSSANSTAANVLPHVGDFDFAIENPVTLDVLRALIGEDVTFEEFDMM